MSPSAKSGSVGNQLLDCLPEGVCRRLMASAAKVSLAHGDEIYRQNGPLTYVYFPTSGMCSVVTSTEQGRLTEAATIGSEGMVGLPLILDLDFSPVRATSQVSGECLRIPASSFLAVMEMGGILDRLLRRYVSFSLTCAYQTVACNALHSVQERMCRWLLMTHDRVRKDKFVLTHEFLAEMLGVRRQSITVLAGTLQKAGFIKYRRGHMQIIDRQGLEAASCECYAMMRELYDRIMN